MWLLSSAGLCNVGPDSKVISKSSIEFLEQAILSDELCFTLDMFSGS